MLNDMPSDPAWVSTAGPHTNRSSDSLFSTDIWRSFFVPALFHIPLVLLLRAFPLLGLVYVVLLLLVGLNQLKKEEPFGLILWSAYVSSAELIWRMTDAPVFWETGKYLLILLLGLGILRWRLKLSFAPLMYLLVLVPSAILTLSRLGLSGAREFLSFNLSGPFLIGVAAIFFYKICLPQKIFSRFLLTGIIPIVGVFTLALNSTLTAENLLFHSFSNFATSGGYGPNQVSAVLGLGVFYCWLYFFVARPNGSGYWLLVGVTLAFLGQAILTFSRGGVYNLAFAIPVATFFFTRGQKQVQRRIFSMLFILGLALLFLIPKLNELTAGMLLTRYEDLSLSGREQIIRSDLLLWSENPILGVGAGVSSMIRRDAPTVASAASHTEYTRLLAEHGVLGLLAILFMLSMVWRSYSQARGGLAKGSALGLSIWALAEMTHAAMRIAAISLVFALPLAIFALEEECDS